MSTEFIVILICLFTKLHAQTIGWSPWSVQCFANTTCLLRRVYKCGENNEGTECRSNDVGDFEQTDLRECLLDSACSDISNDFLLSSQVIHFI